MRSFELVLGTPRQISRPYRANIFYVVVDSKFF